MASRRQLASARQLFAQNLRRLRQEKGLSQDQLAHLAGIHRTYVGAVERCEKNISIDSMQKLAIALGCSLLRLLEEPE
jgi:transcriptional regulator with XRE-family HTH domain